MSESVYINDPRGGRVPLTDEFGNLSIEVMFLYNEGKLPDDAKAMVDEIVANDEMAKDALEGYALMNSAPKAKAIVGDIGHQITTGKAAKKVVPLPVISGRTWAIAASFALVIGIGSVLIAQMMNGDQLAVNDSQPEPEPKETTSETATNKRPEFDLVSDSIPNNQEFDLDVKDELSTTGSDAGTVDRAQELEIEELAEEPVKSPEREELLAKMAALKEKQKAVGNEVIAEQDAASRNANANGVMDDLELAEDVAYKAEEEAAVSSRIEQKRSPASSVKAESVNTNAVSGDEPNESSESNIVYHDPRTFFSFELVEDKPVFPGGDVKMWEFIESNKVHNEDLKSRSIGGDVFVSFVINESGKVTNVEILSSNAGSPQLEEDAKRVIRSMPKWVPGMMNGNPVKVTKTMMVRYPVN